MPYDKIGCAASILGLTLQLVLELRARRTKGEDDSGRGGPLWLRRGIVAALLVLSVALFVWTPSPYRRVAVVVMCLSIAFAWPDRLQLGLDHRDHRGILLTLLLGGPVLWNSVLAIEDVVSRMDMADTAVVALHGATLDTMQATPDDGSASLVLPVITAAVALSGFGAHIPIGECEVYLEILHDELGYVYLRSEGQDVSVVDGRASGSDDTTMVLFAGLAVWLPQRHVRTIASLHAAGDVAVRFMYPLHASPPGAASMQSPMSSRRRCRIVVDTGSRKIASQPVVLQMLGAAEQWHALDTQSTSPVDPRSFYDALAPSLLPPPVQR